MPIFVIAYMMGLSGCWILADAIASLYTYTGNNQKAAGQNFWRDHLLRIWRGLVGIYLMYLGYLLSLLSIA